MSHGDLDKALLALNGWLGRRVRLLVLIRHGAPPAAAPPSGAAAGWHLVLGHEGPLGRPRNLTTDLDRQVTIGTYELGDPLPTLLLGGMPCERVLVSDDR